jgi:uncharacterized protein
LAAWSRGTDLLTPGPDRIAALDLLRGLAVLGILAINIAGFAGPQLAATTPNLPDPGSPADEAAFALGFVLFEGKMRALFTILFGASMVLFMERAEAACRNAPALQLRRLGWLALFGYLHFVLLWWGDILFSYALSGVVALTCWRVPSKPLVALGLAVFVLWHVQGAVASLPEVVQEERVHAGSASSAENAEYRDTVAEWIAHAEEQEARQAGSWPALIRYKLTVERFRPLAQTIIGFGETLPLMLIGMALFRSGLFSGGWPRRRMWLVALGGVGIGGALTLGALAFAWPRHFPPVLMNALLSSWMAVPHLLMAVGYAALAMIAAPRLLDTGPGRALAAAGRMAFSNYIGTSLVMTALFYGWGLGLIGSIGAAGQWGFVLFGWVLMLAWSPIWLAGFRQGPLEWLWRSLVQWRALALRR